eukprot:gene14996-21055_t
MSIAASPYCITPRHRRDHQLLPPFPTPLRTTRDQQLAAPAWSQPLGALGPLQQLLAPPMAQPSATRDHPLLAAPLHQAPSHRDQQFSASHGNTPQQNRGAKKTSNCLPRPMGNTPAAPVTSNCWPPHGITLGTVTTAIAAPLAYPSRDLGIAARMDTPSADRTVTSNCWPVLHGNTPHSPTLTMHCLGPPMANPLGTVTPHIAAPPWHKSPAHRDQQLLPGPMAFTPHTL